LPVKVFIKRLTPALPRLTIRRIVHKYRGIVTSTDLKIECERQWWAGLHSAMTAMYHWIFVPLTLELSFLIAFFESIYVKTGNEEWKKVTKFWMILFGINFCHRSGNWDYPGI